MKINFLGDSITQGAGAERPENMYTTLVADYFKAEECNYGIGGTRIAKQIKPTNNPDDDVFMCRAVKLPRDADFTFVFGGPGSYAILLFIALYCSITSHIHNWVLFLLWLHPFILSGVISPLISSSILSDHSTMNRPSWVAPQAWLHFIELDKAVVLV